MHAVSRPLIIFREFSQKQQECRHLPTECILPIKYFSELMGPKLTQAEGWILGLGAKIFTIAGTAIAYGILASVIYGVIYWIMTIF